LLNAVVNGNNFNRSRDTHIGCSMKFRWRVRVYDNIVLINVMPSQDHDDMEWSFDIQVCTQIKSKTRRMIIRERLSMDVIFRQTIHYTH